jgi:hypothetical protein
VIDNVPKPNNPGMFDATQRPYNHRDCVTSLDEHPNQVLQLTWIPTLGAIERSTITR